MHPNTLAGKRVLIAEDEPVIAMDHAAQLVQAGAKIVATCATVQGAVDCLREKPIDVAVIDFVLADGNSERLQAALKRNAYSVHRGQRLPARPGAHRTGPGDFVEARDRRVAMPPRRGGL